MKYSINRVLVVLLIIICTIAIDVTWKHYLEKSSRVQASYNLKQAQTCVNDILLGNSNSPIYNVNITDDDIEKALKTCAREMKISPTGDIFAFDLRTKNFVFDPSLDCYVEGGKSMTVESECVLHYDKGLCNNALKLMLTGYNSSVDMMTFWKFNSSKEYLEWIVLPNESIGFDGVPRGGLLQPKQIVLAQGIQEDELWARYKGFRMIVYAIGFMSVIINLLLAVKDNMMEEYDAAQ